VTAGTATTEQTTRRPPRRLTPRERARQRCPASELLVIDHAGQLTDQLELSLAMLAVAVDLLAAVSGKYRDQVVDALELAASVEMGA